METVSRFKGAIIGGAAGDALGYPVEFMSLGEIKNTYGRGGIKDLRIVPGYGKAVFSDDTQMSLFTADGMIRGFGRTGKREAEAFTARWIFDSYKEWYTTQTELFPAYFGAEGIKNESAHYKRIGNLLDYPELYKSRAPGNACMSALGGGKMGTMEKPINGSKGCGGVMRAAPVGLFFFGDPEVAFKVGCETGAATHGHPTGYLAAGAMAAIVSLITAGAGIEPAAAEALSLLKREKGSGECVWALDKALSAGREDPSAQKVGELGEGWVAEEALAIGVYSALCFPEDFRSGVMLAVNHGGDSDSTGSICGNILGAFGGERSVPGEWAEALELYELLDGMAEELFDAAEEYRRR